MNQQKDLLDKATIMKMEIVTGNYLLILLVIC